MKKLLTLAALAAITAGCNTPPKMRDIEVKGMYVNGYSEVLAIGAGRLTSIPGEREALAAHYREDTSWLSPATKTHELDIFLVGTNSVENSREIIKAICQAFAEVAPTVSSNNAAVAKSGGTTPLDVVKGGGEVRKAVELAKAEAGKAAASGAAEAAVCEGGECAPGGATPDSEWK